MAEATTTAADVQTEAEEPKAKKLGKPSSIKWHETAGPDGKELAKRSLKAEQLNGYWEIFDSGRAAMIPDDYFEDELQAAEYGILYWTKREEKILESVQERVNKCRSRRQEHEDFKTAVAESGSLAKAKTLAKRQALLRELAELDEMLEEDME